SPLAQAVHVGAAFFADEVDAEGIAPTDKAHLVLEGGLAGNAESIVIEGPVLETVRAPGNECTGRTAKEVQHQIEQVRAQVREDARALVAPRGALHVAGCAVAVKKASKINLAERAGGEQFLQPANVRL